MSPHRTRSRLANAFLGILGSFFIGAGIVVAVWLLVATWGYASRLEFALLLVMLASAVFGGYLIAIAKGIPLASVFHRRHRLRSRATSPVAPASNAG